MKNLKSLTIIMMLLSVLTVSAQVPQGMNYQAVARDAGSNLLANKSISIRITITNGNNGPVLYKETHHTTTNQLGLFDLNIGNGTPDTATFAAISWATVTAWMQVEMDPNGGSSFVVMGNSQLLSVPYALFAGSSNTGQSCTSVYGTAGINITSADTTIPLKIIPGLTETVNVPVNSKLLISTNGAIGTTSGVAAGYSIVDLLVYIDGNYAGQGFYKRVVAANTTGLQMLSNWSLTNSVVASPGNHTVDVRVFYGGGSTANVSGDNTSVLQGSLTVTVIKN